MAQFHSSLTSQKVNKKTPPYFASHKNLRKICHFLISFSFQEKEVKKGPQLVNGKLSNVQTFSSGSSCLCLVFKNHQSQNQRNTLSRKKKNLYKKKPSLLKNDFLLVKVR